MSLYKLEVLTTLCFSRTPTEIEVCNPLHTWTSIPLRTTSLPINKLFHIHELLDCGLTLLTCSSLQYRSIEATRLSGLVINLYACFLRRALFISFVLLIPIPPFDLDKHKEFQFLRGRFNAYLIIT